HHRPGLRAARRRGGRGARWHRPRRRPVARGAGARRHRGHGQQGGAHRALRRVPALPACGARPLRGGRDGRHPGGGAPHRGAGGLAAAGAARGAERHLQRGAGAHGRGRELRRRARRGAAPGLRRGRPHPRRGGRRRGPQADVAGAPGVRPGARLGGRAARHARDRAPGARGAGGRARAGAARAPGRQPGAGRGWLGGARAARGAARGTPAPHRRRHQRAAVPRRPARRGAAARAGRRRRRHRQRCARRPAGLPARRAGPAPAGRGRAAARRPRRRRAPRRGGGRGGGVGGAAPSPAAGPAAAPLAYRSTRGAPGVVGFAQALLAGLAADGGLYLPERLPPLPAGWEAAASVAELARLVLPPFVGEAGAEAVADALGFDMPVVALGDDFVLELFHGPTAAFKDVGARSLARLMDAALAGAGRRATVLVATSGDTGGAVADAFAGLPHARVALLYPDGGVSPRQEEQLTVAREGVRAFAVRGSLDDCQRLAKGAFADPALAGLGLTSANSINVGRLLPQPLYHLWGVAEVRRRLEANVTPRVVVPSGNLGNLAAGLMA